MKQLFFYLTLILGFYSLQSKSQVIMTIAGGGTGGGTDGWGSGLLATNAILGNFCGITPDTKGNLFIADKDHNIIRKVDAITGIITTIAGNDTAGYSGDSGIATSAKIHNPGWIAFDHNGNLFFSDRSNHRIRKVDTSGIITTIAGNGIAGFSGDSGSAILASLNAPQGVCIDRFDNLYITDNGNHRVRKIDALGIITTIAGNGIIGDSGDGGPADSAEFKGIYGIRTDTSGNIYISDYNDDRIRMINVITGIISTVAGNGVSAYTGDGVSAISSGINPFDVSIDDTGNIYIADLVNNRIRKVTRFGIIYTVAGNGTMGYSGDGDTAMLAELNAPAGLNFDLCGNLLIADNQNHRVRKITYPPTLTIPTISLSGATSVSAGSTVTVNATVTNAGSSYVIYWMNHGTEFTTTTVPYVTYIKPAGTDTITAKVVPTGYGCWDSTTSSAWVVHDASETAPSNSPCGGGLSVFPNPVRGSLTLTLSQGEGTAMYKLLSIVGAVLGEGVLHVGSNSIIVEGLPVGVYVLEVVDGEGNKTVKKIVKE